MKKLFLIVGSVAAVCIIVFCVLFGYAFISESNNSTARLNDALARRSRADSALAASEKKLDSLRNETLKDQ